MARYRKDRSALDWFEDRYISALRARMGMETFLHAEMNVIEELVLKEEDRIKSETAKIQKATEIRVKTRTIADKVIEENRERILKYPRLTIHAEASEDVERLYGALGVVEREFWSDLEHTMRRAYTSIVLSPRARLEQQILRLCSANGKELPPRLNRYNAMFTRFPRNYNEIDKEAKNCILEAAFFLADLGDTLKEIDKVEMLPITERQKVATVMEYVHNVLNDFRLKDFKNLPR